MTIALVGKGGSGKTTLAATLARLFARMGYRVDALDDDPNPNLAAALGLTPEQRAALSPLPRDQVLEKRTDPDGRTSLHLTRPFEEVIEEYGSVGPEGVRVLLMTGLIGAGQG